MQREAHTQNTQVQEGRSKTFSPFNWGRAKGQSLLQGGVLYGRKPEFEVIAKKARVEDPLFERGAVVTNKHSGSRLKPSYIFDAEALYFTDPPGQEDPGSM